jgi:hypothetical protein
MVRFPLILLAFLPALGACSPAVMTGLNLSDILAVSKTGEPIVIPAMLHIPLTDDAPCAAEIADYVAKLAEIMPATGGKCVMTPGAAHAEIETTATLIQLETERPEEGALVLEIDTAISGHRIYELTLYSRVTLDQIGIQLGLEGIATDPEIVFAINNDLGRQVGVQFSGVFYNGWPAMPDQGILLDAGDSVPVQLSDVTTAVIAEGNGNEFMQIFDIHMPLEGEQAF